MIIYIMTFFSKNQKRVAETEKKKKKEEEWNGVSFNTLVGERSMRKIRSIAPLSFPFRLCHNMAKKYREAAKRVNRDKLYDAKKQLPS